MNKIWVTQQYAQNVHCDEWNENTQIASWKRIHKYGNRQQNDDFTQLAYVTMPTNPHETGNL